MLPVVSFSSLLDMYGFSSPFMPPYIYSSKHDKGIYFSFVDEKFGLIERVVLFQSIYKAEEFLKLYQWYKKEGKNNDVELVLDRYEEPFVTVRFMRHGHELTVEEQRDPVLYDKEQRALKEEEMKVSVLDEAEKLLKYYAKLNLKRKKLEETRNALLAERDLELVNLQCYIDDYNHNKRKSQLEETTPMLPVDFESEYRHLVERLYLLREGTPTLAEVYHFLRIVWDALFEAENEKENYDLELEIANLDYEIGVLLKKEEFLKEELRKNSFLRTKISLKEKLKEIETSYFDPTVLQVKVVVEEKKKKCEEKYHSFSKLHPLKLKAFLEQCERANSTDISKLVLKYKSESLDVEEIKPFSFAKTLLERIYEKELTQDEKKDILLYYSPLRDFIKAICEVDGYEEKDAETLCSLLSITDGFSNIKARCYEKMRHIIDDYHNIEIAKDLFQDICFDNLEFFVSSLLHLISNLKKIAQRLLFPVQTYGFYKIKEIDKKKSPILTLYEQSLLDCQPILSDELKERALLKRGVCVLYSNYEVVIGSEESVNALQIVSRKSSTIDLFTDLNELIYDDNITLLSSFDIVKDGNFVTELKLKDKIRYQEVIISPRKESQNEV